MQLVTCQVNVAMSHLAIASLLRFNFGPMAAVRGKDEMSGDMTSESMSTYQLP